MSDGTNPEDLHNGVVGLRYSPFRLAAGADGPELDLIREAHVSAVDDVTQRLDDLKSKRVDTLKGGVVTTLVTLGAILFGSALGMDKFLIPKAGREILAVAKTVVALAPTLATGLMYAFQLNDTRFYKRRQLGSEVSQIIVEEKIERGRRKTRVEQRIEWEERGKESYDPRNN